MHSGDTSLQTLSDVAVGGAVGAGDVSDTLGGAVGAGVGAGVGSVVSGDGGVLGVDVGSGVGAGVVGDTDGAVEGGGAWVGGRTKQMVQPALVTEPSLCHWKAEPALAATACGPLRP